MNAQSNIDIPETTEDFNKLDFSTRCAVAGLQLGRTKVFLRREAFDCFIFHDVDLLPEDDRNSYDCPPDGQPRVMSVQISKYFYR